MKSNTGSQEAEVTTRDIWQSFDGLSLHENWRVHLFIENIDYVLTIAKM